MKLTLREILQDCLVAQKFMVSIYDQFLKEASNPELLEMLLTNYNELADTLHAVFVEMKERNFYPVENAEKQKIEEAIQNLTQVKKCYKKDF